MDYSNIQEQVELIKEINREFKKHGISEEAHMAYEYVVALKDENWRNAIETFLGVHRYAIIVSKDAFDIANAVLDRSRYRYVELVNTKRLMSKKLECKEDSVFLYLDIQNNNSNCKYNIKQCHKRNQFLGNASDSLNTAEKHHTYQ